MTGREPNPNSDQEGRAQKWTSPSLFSASRSVERAKRQAALRSTRAILRYQVACGAINGVIAAIGTIIVTSRPEGARSPGISPGRKKAKKMKC